MFGYLVSVLYMTQHFITFLDNLEFGKKNVFKTIQTHGCSTDISDFFFKMANGNSC